MKLYMIQFDGQRDYVEAESYGAALKAWHAHMMIEQAPDWDGTEEPESVALVHDEPVIR